MNEYQLRIAIFAAAACCLLLIGGREPDAIAARRERVARMTQDEKAQLARSWERFQALSKNEQEKLRRLDREINADEHAGELRDVMRRYYQWCIALPTYQRLELMELSAKERIAHISIIKRESEDAEGLKKWLDEKADKIIATLTAKQQKRLAEVGPAGKKFLLFRMLTDMSKGADGDIRKLLSDQDLADLRSQLSEQTRRLLESKTPSEQWEFIVQRLHRRFRAEMAGRRLNRMRGGGRLRNTTTSGVADEELAKLFENLPPNQQDLLLSLPAEEMLDQLHQQYLEPHFPRTDRIDRRKHPDPRQPDRSRRHMKQ